MSVAISKEAMAEFFSECEEILQRFNATLSAIEKGQETEKAIASLYREMHTLKGSAQLFGFSDIAAVAHAIEACLEPMRRLKIPIPRIIIDSLYHSADVIDKILRHLNEGQSVPSELSVRALDISGKMIEQTSTFFGTSLLPQKEVSAPVELNREAKQNLSATVIEISPLKEIKMGGARPDAVAESVGSTTMTLEAHAQDKLPKEVKEIKEVKEEGAQAISDATSSVRISVGILDKLMNLAGEMVLIRNQFLQYGQQNDDHEFQTLSKGLDLVTNDIQYEVMKTRMQPISSVLNKFQRIVRDIGRDLSKQIDLAIIGGETELDKTLIEAIKDPLTHILRNSCDHGLERPDERIAKGKSSTGKITISAIHEAGQVIIEIADDGRGLNPEKLLKKAIEKGVIKAEAANQLTENEVFQLIFAPGFSTAEQVSQLSGRGVGMDVVKTNIEKIGGAIHIASKLDKGLSIKLQIPLTLAVIPTLLVVNRKEKYSIPQMRLLELVRIEENDPERKIELLQGRPFLRLRGILLPLISLDHILAGKSDLTSEKMDFKKTCYISVVQGQGQNFGILVETILDTVDIVVKPLPSFLKKISLFSGATILGDGSVSLILDINGIGQMANLRPDNKSRAKQDPLEIAKNIRGDSQDFLFFKLKSKEAYCMPLCLVNRLEEVDVAKISSSGERPVVTYRGSILPLIDLNQKLKLVNNNVAHGKNEKQSIIVVHKRNMPFGIMVDDIVDVKYLPAQIEDCFTDTLGIMGALVHGNEVSTVIDVLSIIESEIGTPLEDEIQTADTQISKLPPLKILYAEDTIFFYKQVKKYLEQAGCSIEHAGNGVLALERLAKAKRSDFDILISDIEMPEMNGLEFAKEVRRLPVWKDIPMVALTTKFRDVDLEQGKLAGFDDYLEKLKSDQLIQALGKLCKNIIKQPINKESVR